MSVLQWDLLRVAHVETRSSFNRMASASKYWNILVANCNQCEKRANQKSVLS